jgi:hypothetical protein
MYQHFSRIYFLGNNRIDAPWNIPLNPPMTLRNRVKLDKYYEFAQSINEAMDWNNYERIMLNVLKIL